MRPAAGNHCAPEPNKPSERFAIDRLQLLEYEYRSALSDLEKVRIHQKRKKKKKGRDRRRGSGHLVADL